MAKIPFAINNGAVGDTTARVVIYASSSTAVTINWNGEGAAAVTMDSLGTDGLGGATDSFGTVPVGLYVGVVNKSGLSPNTEYTYTVTQGSDTRSGSTRTNPTGNFTVFFGSCDAPTDNGSAKGCYGYIKSIAENGPYPVHGLVMADDFGYTDTVLIDDTGATGTGRFALTHADQYTNVYSRAIAYAAYFGLLDTYEGGGIGSSLYSGHDYARVFSDTDRQWCFANIPTYRSIGDHEVTNNPEILDTVEAGLLTASLSAYSGSVGKVVDPINASNSLAWVHRLGPLEMIAYDRISGLTAQKKVYDDTTMSVQNNLGTPPTGQWLGSTQISDILGEVDTTSVFKMVVASCGTKFLKSEAYILADTDGYTKTSDFGGQDPLHNYTLVSGDSEFLQLMTEKSSSICSKAETAGGVVFTAHGDTHRPYLYYHYYPESSTHTQLDMLEISSGTINGSGTHRCHTDIKAGYAYDGVNVDWMPSWTPYGAGATRPYISTCLRLDVIQTASPMRIEWSIIECAAGTTDYSEPVVIRTGTITENASTLGSDHYRKGNL